MTFSKGLRLGFVLLVGTTAVIILFILSGTTDPKPLGELVVKRPLFPQIIAPQAPKLSWLEEQLPPGNYSVRLTAAQEAESEARGRDIGYGLALGNDDNHLAVAVSPLGYLSVWQKNGQETDVIMPWQLWPHVKRGMEPNEIWLDVENGRLTIRINREFLWEGEIEPLSGNIGVVGESLGESAIVNFQWIELFSKHVARDS